MKKEQINTAKAPVAIGPYSQAIRAGELVFVSGQLPVNAESGVMPGDIKAQTRESLTNLKSILEEAGSGLDSVLKTTVFLSDMNNFAAMNEVYQEMFAGTVYPSRSAVQVARLPKDAMVEIEAIAVVRPGK